MDYFPALNESSQFLKHEQVGKEAHDKTKTGNNCYVQLPDAGGDSIGGGCLQKSSEG